MWFTRHKTADALTPETAQELVTAERVRDRLDAVARARFDDEWRAVLAAVRRSYDLDHAKALERSWWLVSGGDRRTAQLAEQQARTLSSARSATYGRFHAAAERNGPAVYAQISEADRADFDREWGEACDVARYTFDLVPLEGLITKYWAHTELRHHDASPSV
ncbi:hypothetical protein LX16_2520 [Stackebrandtia albiflava]|uniref:Uncharacterized protein n=1 Tax=Stackebrandtia albiflava TaxID=406432 RepID=A0A562V1R4_9ACTN|nr:DUF6247 family protein [Stackebrandtia albiflava]TWJ11785.1 hypothetical protein LX16_2520 [Stackebrandtia albiflava]